MSERKGKNYGKDCNNMHDIVQEIKDREARETREVVDTKGPSCP